MSTKRALLLAPLALFLIVTPGFAQDPAKVGPKIYHQKLENDRVRVFEVTFAPHQSIGMHSHPDHVVYVVTPGTLQITEKGKAPATMKLKAGDTVFLKAQTHSAKNLGNTRIKLVVTELKG